MSLLRQPAGLRATPAKLTAGLLVGIVRVITGVRAQWLHGRSRRPCVYFANHASHADFLLLWATLPAPMRARTRPVAARDYWLSGWLRRFLAQNVFRSVMIERHREGRTGDPVAAMATALDAGDSLVLFPEGTRNTGAAKLLPLKPGLFRLARARTKTEFVPVWIDNLNRVLPKGALIPVPHSCTVRFGPSLKLNETESQAAFMERARRAMLALSARQSVDVAFADR